MTNKPIQYTLPGTRINPNAVMCPYCGERAVLTTSKEVYNGQDYGPVYLCKCKKGWAYVGCHPGTTRPLGRLADAQLRAAKKGAHRVFDKLWKRKGGNRKKAYAWLAEQLGISGAECHIGEMDVDLCLKVIDVCKNKLQEE